MLADHHKGHIPDILLSMSESGVTSCHTAGFALACDLQPPPPSTAKGHRTASMVDSFIGPYGGQLVSGSVDGFEWTATLPGPDQLLSTWSQYADSRGQCLIEGDFYSGAWGYRPQVGFDPELAKRVLEIVLSRGIDHVDDLNGVFSGAVYSHRDRRLFLFVDRVGARMLYYRTEGQRCEAATNLYGFSGSTASLDPHALNEHLILGFPLESKTLFGGILLVPPATVVEWANGAGRKYRYTKCPQRRGHLRLAESAAMVSAALDRHIRDVPLRSQWSIALSGGKDSRAVLAAILRTGHLPRALTFASGGDVPNALRVSKAVGLPLRTVAVADGGMAFDFDSALLTDGYAFGWGFLSIAAAAALDHSVLFTGFSGDYISGSWEGVMPWRRQSVDDVAMSEFRLRGTEVPPELAAACLSPELIVPYEDIVGSFLESYRRQYADTPDMVTTYLLHRIENRNRRRIAPTFNGMRTLCSARHPFTDRFVIEAYLEMPISSLIGQGAHCLVAMDGVPELGSVSTGASWLPLKYEVACRRWMATAKESRRQIQAAARRLIGRSPDAATWWPGRLRRFAVARESPLFNRHALDARRNDAPLVRAVGKLAATAIHVAAMSRTPLPSAPPPVILRETPQLD
jgi:asparagine synthetase B (glutamine-hydrolysing)